MDIRVHFLTIFEKLKYIESFKWRRLQFHEKIYKYNFFVKFRWYVLPSIL